MIELEDFGFNSSLEKYSTDNKLENFAIGRVVEEHKERYKVMTNKGEFEAEVVDSLSFMADSREEFSPVGDWVILSTCDNDIAIIHKILPRFSSIKRQHLQGTTRYKPSGTCCVGCGGILIDNPEMREIGIAENFLKMEREKAHFEFTVVEKREKDKQFDKMLRNYKKDIQKIN